MEAKGGGLGGGRKGGMGVAGTTIDGESARPQTGRLESRGNLDPEDVW